MTPLGFQCTVSLSVVIFPVGSLVGPSKDKLQLQLRLSSPSQTRPYAYRESFAFASPSAAGIGFWCSARHHRPQHQERGLRLQISATGVAKHPNQICFIAAPGYERGPGRCRISPDYGFIPAATTPPSKSWPDGNAGEANSSNFPQRRSPLSPVLSYGVGFLFSIFCATLFSTHSCCL
jgi:hypothetical protein